MRRLPFLALLAAIAAPLPAAAFVTDNGFRTYPAGEDSVIVRPLYGGAPRSYFCAAADWALRVKGAPYGAYLVMTRGVARDPDFGGAFTARITLAPAGSGNPPSGITVSGRTGTSMSVAQARNVCLRLPFIPD